MSSRQRRPSGVRGRWGAAGRRPTAATAPLTTPLRTSRPTAGRPWAASQLVANRGPAEGAAGTHRRGERPSRLTTGSIYTLVGSERVSEPRTPSVLQGGGPAAGGLRPGDGVDQQTDGRIQSFPVQRGEPALH